MTNREYCSGWRQVRVFTRNRSEFWYPGLLHAVVSPLVAHHQHHDLFVSKYRAPLGRDDGDTLIGDLPPQYLFAHESKQWHSSVWIRYRFDDTFEAEPRKALEHESELWYSDFLDYDLQSDLGGPRFCPTRKETALLHRATLIGEVLCSNSRVVLDAIVEDGPNIRFEQNQDKENMPLGSAFQSIGHTVCNAWELWQGGPVPVFVLQGNLYRLC